MGDTCAPVAPAGPQDGGDVALLQALAAGLPAAFEALIVAYQERLFSFALRMTGNREDAEESVQDALVRAYRALAGYDQQRILALALHPWLYQITLNVVRNRYRRRRLTVCSLDGTGVRQGQWEPPASGPTPESSALSGERLSVLAALLARLPVRQRTTVVLRHVEGLSIEEIAVIVGVPAGTIKSDIFRGLRRLRDAAAAVGLEVE